MQNTEQQGDKYRNHAQVWLLLPWYINGSLSADEKQRITEHAAVCLSCRKELALQSTLRDSVRDHELDELRVSANFDRLSAKLQAEDSAVPHPLQDRRSRAGLADSFAAWKTRWQQYLTPQYLAGALSVLALAAILPGVTATLFPGNNTFKTLSNTGPETPAPADLRLIFADGVAAAERDAIIDRAGLRIVSGPDERGLYFVEARGELSTSALAATLEQLRSDENIMFAEFAPNTADDQQAGER